MDIQDSSIPYATIGEVIKGKGAQMVTVEDDVLDVVRSLKRIDPRLNVRWNPYQEYFVIYEFNEDTRIERLVTTTKVLDGRVVKHFEKLASESWDAVAEMEQADDQAEKDKNYQFAEKVGEIGERLHHAIRRDKSFDQDRIWVPASYKWKIEEGTGLRNAGRGDEA